VELINELLFSEVDITDENSTVTGNRTADTLQSLHDDTVSQTPTASAEVTVDPTVVNREAIRKIRIEVSIKFMVY